MKIPIILLTRNNFEQLKLTVESIIKNTQHKYKLVIADNCSEDPLTINYLEYLETSDIKVVRNKSNLWVLGLNPAIEWVEENIEHDLVVISDSDLLFPSIENETCWLEALYKAMDKYPVIGKLGLSLSLENIVGKTELEHIYHGELKYYEEKLFDDVYLAPVDTTVAIYRKDLFVYDRFRFYPGHGSYIKPYYHVGRLSSFLPAYHLGWDSYDSYEVPIFNVNQKVYCFTIVAGFIDKTILSKASLKYRLFYKYFKNVFKAYWTLRLFVAWFFYIFSNKLINLNTIYVQSKSKY